MRRSGFVQGLGVGAIGTLLGWLGLMYGLQPRGAAGAGLPAVDDALAWVYANLGLSMPVFALLLILYVASLRRLRAALAAGAAVEQVAQTERLLDIWINLFFGVGVIWTAIGMRGALVHALDDPAVALDRGAYAILERMVDGGILLALSTTIFGGIGGYLLRVVKALTVETELSRFYDQVSQGPGAEMQSTLRAIETRLQQLVESSTEREEARHGEARVAVTAAE